MVRFDDAAAVFFDVDNTLYDFEGSMGHAFAHLKRAFPEPFARHEVERLSEAYWSFYHGYDEEAKRALIETDPDLFRRTMWAGALGRLALDEDDAACAWLAEAHPSCARFADVDGFARVVTEEFVRERPRHWREAMYPGVVETLEGLRGRRRVLGAITNGPGPVQRPKLEALDTRGFFPEPLRFISGEFGVYKPDARIFLAAAKAAGVAPEACVMVGDAREFDMPAKAVGFRTILFDGKSQKPDTSRDPYPPDATARSYEELRALLGV